ncbi:hypothetical protein V8C44DRAFT_167389 [Trichoderma aethiopicum]
MALFKRKSLSATEPVLLDDRNSHLAQLIVKHGSGLYVRGTISCDVLAEQLHGVQGGGIPQYTSLCFGPLRATIVDTTRGKPDVHGLSPFSVSESARKGGNGVVNKRGLSEWEMIGRGPGCWTKRVSGMDKLGNTCQIAFAEAWRPSKLRLCIVLLFHRQQRFSLRFLSVAQGIEQEELGLATVVHGFGDRHEADTAGCMMSSGSGNKLSVPKAEGLRAEPFGLTQGSTVIP